MKSVLLLLFLDLILVKYSSGQGYRPFVRDSVHWHISEQFCLGNCDPGGGPANNGDFNYTDDIYLKLAEDTTVQGIVFKKLIQTMDRTCRCPPGNNGPYPLGQSPCSTLGIVREDTIARKVYIKKVNHPYTYNWCIQDSVLFDFSKGPGDSVLWPYSCADTFFMVDSVYYSTVSNISVKTWSLHEMGYFGHFELYESIGSSLGFWGSTPSFEGSYSTFLGSYCIGSDSSCGFSCNTVNGISSLNLRQSSILVMPNPVNDILTIQVTKNTGDQDLKFVITDLLGKELYKNALASSNNVVNFFMYAPGVYLWYLTDEGKVLQTGKVLHE